MANRLPHQQRCPRPGPTLHEEIIIIIFGKYSQSLLLFLHFHLVPAYIFQYTTSEPLIYCLVPNRSHIVHRQGLRRSPENMRCICNASCIFDMLPHRIRQGEWIQTIEHSYQLLIWVLAPEVSGHILVSPAFLFPFQILCTNTHSIRDFLSFPKRGW